MESHFNKLYKYIHNFIYLYI